MRWLLLPGLDGTGQLFFPLLQALPRNVEANVIQYPQDRIQSYQELCERVVAALPDEPFVIVAESFSGPVAIRVAAEAPLQLRALVLCASFAQIPGNPALRGAMIWLSDLLFAFDPPRWAVRHFLTGEASPELVASFYEAVRSLPASILGARLRMALATDERQSLSLISTPLLYLHATQDYLLGDRCVESFRCLHRDCTIAHVNAPHFVLQRAPRAAVRKITAWLQTRGLDG